MIFLTDNSARHKKKHEGRKTTAIILWWWVVFWSVLIMSQLKTQRNPRHPSTPAPAHRHTSENPWCLISPASSVQPASNFLAKQSIQEKAPAMKI